MGRHSQSSSLSTTLVGLGELAQKSLTTGAAHGRRHADGPARTSISPVMYRAGGVAAAFSLAISGGAYAATQLRDTGAEAVTSMQANLNAIGASDASSSASGLTVASPSSEVVTETEDVTTKHGTVKKETADLAEGETKVETKGVDGLARTTYQVTKSGDTEVSRTVVSSVVVTEKVDEVVLVGTGTSTTSTASTDASSTTTTATTAVSGTDAASAQAIARSMLSTYGWGDDQFSCLVSLWNRESGWNYQATNASSGAYGIPQALPGSKMSSAGADWQTNPATQISWGLGYISGRYGSPCNAWAHSQSTGWY